MFRLMAMTFFGGYRGPAWETAGAPRRGARVAAVHGAPHPADPHAHGQAHLKDHEVTHGPAEPHDHSPTPTMRTATPPRTTTRMRPRPRPVARPARIADADDVPADGARGRRDRRRVRRHSGGARRRATRSSTSSSRASRRRRTRPPAEPRGADAAHAEPGEGGARRTQASHGGRARPDGLLGADRRRRHPDRAEVLRHEPGDLRAAWRSGSPARTARCRTSTTSTSSTTRRSIAGTIASARGLWTFDRKVVDGAVNGTGWVTVISSWFSGLTDRTIVDGAVNLVGWVVQESSYGFRRFQTGLRAELRAADAVRHLRVRRHLSVRR